jgi:serine/threonine-protein kinase
LAAKLEALAATLPRPQALPISAAPRELIEGPPTLAGLPTPPTASESALAPVAFDPTRVLDQTSRVAAGPDQVFDLDAFEPPTSRGRRTRNSGSGSRRRGWTIVLSVLIVVAVIAAGLVLALNKGVFTPSHPVPAITGKTVAEARQALSKDHFTLVTQTPVSSITVPAGRIVRQSPSPGSSLKQGSSIDVALSSGLPIEQIPSLLGLGCNGATRLLAVNHLKGSCPPAVADYNNSVRVGEVIDWSYNNKLDATHAPYGATVFIALSKGKVPVPIPNVQGDTYAQAQALLQSKGLVATESSGASTSTPAGEVDHTDPPIGTGVAPGSTVTVFVSTGPPTTQVPNLSGDTVATAQAALQAAGLKLGSVFGPSHGNVFATVPEVGTTVQEGSSVNIYTS